MRYAHPLELRHLRHFVALAEELHFGRAAARVGIAQPPFSQSIAKLEAIFETRLFERRRAGPDRVQLTDAGRALLERAHYTLSDVTDTIEVIQATARGERGRLRVAFVASLANGPLPHSLAAFSSKFPEVALTLSEMTTEPMIERIKRREVDLGLGRELSVAGWIGAELLFHERMYLIAAADSALARRTRVTAQDLESTQFIFPPAAAGGGLRSRILELCAQADIVPTIGQEATEWATILGLVSAGFGISIVPASALTPGIGIKTVPLAAAPWTTSVSACWLAGTHSPSRDHLLEMLRSGWAP